MVLTLLYPKPVFSACIIIFIIIVLQVFQNSSKLKVSTLCHFLLLLMMHCSVVCASHSSCS